MGEVFIRKVRSLKSLFCLCHSSAIAAFQLCWLVITFYPLFLMIKQVYEPSLYSAWQIPLHALNCGGAIHDNNLKQDSVETKEGDEVQSLFKYRFGTQCNFHFIFKLLKLARILKSRTNVSVFPLFS